ncbi:MAG: esterase, depolymerase family [Gemmatimonadetes bacterium]|nr:esterase, depolymerase family [Gemmatimonadota bacterium]
MMIDSAADRLLDPPAIHASAAGAGRVEWATYQGPAGTRRYRIYLPAGYDPSHKAPLVLMLHGCTQDPDDFARGTRMDAVADESGVLLVYPEQPATAQIQRCWTWYDPAQIARDGGEAAVLAGIVGEVEAHHAVDARRVYVLGISAGGSMAVNLAAAYPELFAGVVAHSGIAYHAALGVPQALGAMQGNGLDAERLRGAAAQVLARGGFPPLLVIHGNADPVVRPANGHALARQWADARGLTAGAESAETAGGLAFQRQRFTDAGGHVLVETLFVDGLGHAWSGGSAEGTYTSAAGPDASREAMRFLLAHRRGRR